MKKSNDKTVQITVKLSSETYEALQKLASKEHRAMAEIVRVFVDKGLNINSYNEEVDFISTILRTELEVQIKALGNRLASMLNRLTIISAAGYYANIAIIADLIDKDRYSSFEKIEKIARKKALAYANMKSPDALKIFTDDEEMKKAVEDLKGGENPRGGERRYVDFDV